MDKTLPVECGVNRIMIRSEQNAGKITIKATAPGLPEASLSIESAPILVNHGFYTDTSGKVIEANWGSMMPCILKRGETPLTLSYTQKKNTIAIKYAEAASDTANVRTSYDDNEATHWSSDGALQNAYITYQLARKANINVMVIKVLGFRNSSYPIEVYSGNKLVFNGFTHKGLGYCHIPLKPTLNDIFTIKMIGAASVKEAFADMVELADKSSKQLKSSNKNKLQIIEVEFNEDAK